MKCDYCKGRGVINELTDYECPKCGGRGTYKLCEMCLDAPAIGKYTRDGEVMYVCENCVEEDMEEL